MAYSTNPITVERLRPDLQELEEKGTARWTVEPGRAHHFAQKVREVFYVARLHRERYPRLAAIADVTRVVVVSSREVQAIPKKGLDVVAAPGSVGVAVSGLEDSGAPHVRKGAQSAAAIIHTWLSAQPSNDKFYFPEAALPPLELRKLHKWSIERKLIMLVAHDGALTLQKREVDPRLVPFAWSPEDLESDDAI